MSQQLKFLQLVLPARGFYVGFAVKGSVRRQQAFDTLDALIRWLQLASDHGWHAYFACASFKEKFSNAPGWKLRGEINVESLKFLFLDVDAKETHPKTAKYETREDAWLAGQTFCNNVRLPPPTAVSSGGGAYLLWPLTADLILEQWSLVAMALKAACQNMAFEADHRLTANGAAVLRLPGTVNYKNNRLVEVGDFTGPYDLREFDYLVKEFGKHARPKHIYIGPAIHHREHSPLVAAIANEYGHDPSQPDLIRRGCQIIRSILENPGRFSEPIHYPTAGVFSYATDGREFYKSFLGAEWHDAADYKASQWQARAAGPPLCRHFRDLHPAGCKGCPHESKIDKGEIFSPLFLGRKKVEQDTTKILVGTINGHPWLPEPFKWSATSQLIFLEEDRNGNPLETVVSSYPLYLERIHRTEFGGATWFTFQQYLPQEGWHAITLPANSVFSAHVLPDVALAGGAIREPKLFTRYCHDARDQWVSVNKMQPIYEQFGWKAKNTQFLAGTTLYTAVGQEAAICDQDVIEKSRHIKPQEGGSLRAWVSLINKLTADRKPQVDFAILAGFAAPLMPFFEISEGGTIISLVNRSSGTGKSMVLKMICSIWGQWDGLNQKTIDTHASKGLNMALLGHLPITFDEMANICAKGDPEDLRNFIEIFTGGRDKLRAKQFGGGLQQTPGRWCTLLITSSNYSLVDLLETMKRFVDAPGLRVIEFPVTFPERSDYRLGDEMERELWANAGYAGPVFIQHCMQPEVQHFIKVALRDWTARIWKMGEFKPQHRFWVRALAAIAVAGELATSLGLVPIDPMATVTWAVNELRARAALSAPPKGVAPEQIRATDAVSAFGEYINEHLRDIMICSQSWSPGSRPCPPELRPTGQLLVRYENTAGRLFIPTKEFKTWMTNQGYSFSDAIEAMKNTEIITFYNRLISLGAGTGIPSAPVPCIEWDMKHPAVSQIAREIRSLKNVASES